MAQETSNVTVRLPIDRQRQLDAIANQTDRSRNWIINKAVETYLELYGGQSKRVEAALTKGDDEGLTIDMENVTSPNGAALVAHWQQYGIIGSRPDIEDSQLHARKLRESAESRNNHPPHQ